MEYRMEIDALNALVQEQRRTNELLERLLSGTPENGAQNAAEPKGGQADVSNEPENTIARKRGYKRRGDHTE